MKVSPRRLKRLSCYILLLVISLAHGRISVARKDENGEEITDDIASRNLQREEKENFLAFIVDSTDTVTIESISDDLPLFGVQHTGNRRNLWLRQKDDNERASTSRTQSYGEEHYARFNLGHARRGINRDKGSRNWRGKGVFSTGKGKSSKKSSKKSGKGYRPGKKSGKGYQPSKKSSNKPPRLPLPRPPSQRPIHPPTSRPTSRPDSGCATEINIDFLQFAAIPPALVVANANADEQTLGTGYVYNDGLRDQDTLDELANSKASGSCIRTQARERSPAVGVQYGGGHCQFTYSLRDSRNREIVFTASGAVSDEFGGVLSITGGGKSALGAYGEIELLPVNLLPDGQFQIDTGDFFLDPLFYLADARIVVPCN